MWKSNIVHSKEKNHNSCVQRANVFRYIFFIKLFFYRKDWKCKKAIWDIKKSFCHGWKEGSEYKCKRVSLFTTLTFVAHEKTNLYNYEQNKKHNQELHDYKKNKKHECELHDYEQSKKLLNWSEEPNVTNQVILYTNISIKLNQERCT